MKMDRFYERAAELGAPDRVQAKRALRAIGRAMIATSRAARARFADVLFVLGEGEPCRDVEELYARVAQTTPLPPGPARELTQILCRVLGEELPGIEVELPPDVRALFQPPAEGDPPPHQDDRGHTLATGRPGSARARGGRDRAQSHSVVREDNPHADTKLSSARGMTQEDVEESLATAHPSDERAISKARG